jgi:hypothetical protein
MKLSFYYIDPLHFHPGINFNRYAESQKNTKPNYLEVFGSKIGMKMCFPIIYINVAKERLDYFFNKI